MLKVEVYGGGKCSYKTIFIYDGPTKNDVTSSKNYVYKPLFHPEVGKIYLFMKHKCEFEKHGSHYGLYSIIEKRDQPFF